MKALTIPAFFEDDAIINRENKGSRVVVFQNAQKEKLDKYEELLLESGFIKKESYARDGHYYSAFLGDGVSYFLNFYEGISELYIVEEQGTLYFEHECAADVGVCTPEITQIGIENFGLSYAVRLSDGRYIIFDGGYDYETDEAKLFNFLKSDSLSNLSIGSGMVKLTGALLAIAAAVS